MHFFAARNDSIWRRRLFLAQKSLARTNAIRLQIGPNPQSSEEDGRANKETSGSRPSVPAIAGCRDKRIDAQRAYYEEGRITLDRFIDACRESSSRN